MKTIHINCDLGEGGEYDAHLMPNISACNIACGGHAGNAESMLRTVLLAIENNVEIGAHPSYPDKENFGRSSIIISEAALKNSILEQILSLDEIAKKQGATLTHIKPHGALYNDAAKDEKTAQIILDSIAESGLNLKLYAPQNSVISELAKGRIKVHFEAFADRNYNPDFSLVSRSESNALIIQKKAVFKQLSSMFLKQEIVCENQEKLSCKAKTFCLHSDTPNSVEILQYLSSEFQKLNVQISKI